MVKQPEFLTVDQLAERWHVTPRTLANWRREFNGPPATKLGKKVLYALPAVEEFERQRTQA